MSKIQVAVVDNLTVAQILSISIYLESGNVQKVSVGRRATVYNRDADMLEIVRTEVIENFQKACRKILKCCRKTKPQKRKKRR